MNEWMMNEPMNEIMNKDECLNLVKIRSIEIAHAVKYVIAFYYEWMNEWTNEWTNEWMNEWIN